MSSLTRVLFILSSLMFTVYAATETLCGAELVDALQFVCGEKGRPNRTHGRRSRTGIVEQCCFQSCSLSLLQQYCARPVKYERDLSSTLLQVFPVSQSLHKDASRTPLSVKYSKYEVWQRKAAQRLRRGVPSILLARNFRRQVEKIKDEEQTNFHRPLITLPDRYPEILPNI
ncbi:insulin-like growth factor II isoform X2 [Myxocyprinus asiaticus]|uniref:insulin-like growth factor II isoform X2 n=1 Tax=Myxocyprinus asiaticus TaxID=70543 RepID=UPI002222BA03|nr:insulin-like growth factor II isoform X2 [Myxocyprinus asiaticus]